MATITYPVVFDNLGRTFDRYTFILSDGDLYYCNAAPFNPCGVGMYGGNATDNTGYVTVDSYVRAVIGDKRFGLRCKDLSQLPQQVRQFINQQLEANQQP